MPSVELTREEARIALEAVEKLRKEVIGEITNERERHPMSTFTIYKSDHAKQSEAHEAVRYFAENLDRIGPRFEVTSSRPVGRVTSEMLEEERGSIAMATRIYHRGSWVSGHDLYRTVKGLIEMTPEDRAKYIIRPRLKNLPVRERRVVERTLERKGL